MLRGRRSDVPCSSWLSWLDFTNSADVRWQTCTQPRSSRKESSGTSWSSSLRTTQAGNTERKRNSEEACPFLTGRRETGWRRRRDIDGDWSVRWGRAREYQILWGWWSMVVAWPAAGAFCTYLLTSANLRVDRGSGSLQRRVQFSLRDRAIVEFHDAPVRAVTATGLFPKTIV